MSSTALIDQNAAAEHLGMSVRTLESWRYHRTGPKFYRVGRSVRYRKSDLNRWILASAN